eukprot:1762-Heterococcus_DN1.PRE.1
MHDYTKLCCYCANAVVVATATAAAAAVVVLLPKNVGKRIFVTFRLWPLLGLGNQLKLGALWP